VVISDLNNRGELYGYYDGNSFIGWQQGFASACNASDYKWQPPIDHYPVQLTGVNPDTGAAWSACEQDTARYGGFYSRYGTPVSRRGMGDWLSGAFRQIPDEWLTITHRIVIGNLGGPANNRITVWVAHDGQPYVMVSDKQNVVLQAGAYNAIWLLPYRTNCLRTGKQVASRTNNIGGISLYACGLFTPIGTGVLEYTASTKLFRWQGAGEPFGIPIGFSVTNGKVLRNILSGGDVDSYLILNVDNAANLPQSGVVTDNIVITDGRPDTQTNYADLIVTNNSPINAPGGFSPLLPTLPYTIPAQGFFKNISLNTLTDVKACQAPPIGAPTWPSCPYGDAYLQGVFYVWTGGAYGSEYSPYGGYFVGPGGGHSSYAGNELYAFNLTTALWDRLRNPSMYGEPDEIQSGPNAGLFPDGQPAPTHAYSTPQYIPGSWFGGVKGKYVFGSFANSNYWGMNLDDAFSRSWVKFTTTSTYTAYSNSARDVNRRGIWLITGSNPGPLRFVDGVTGAVTTYSTSTNVGAYSAIGYSPSLDILLLSAGTYDRLGTAAGGDVSSFFILPASAPNSGWSPGGNKGLVWSGTGPGGYTYSDALGATMVARAGLEWSTILNCFVSMYPGDNGAKVYFFKPPAGATTFAQLVAGTWTWTSETLVGEAGAVPSLQPNPSNRNGGYNRFREVPLLKCFVWADDVTGPTQLWRPTGMV
jgi:hypothetical protein